MIKLKTLAAFGLSALLAACADSPLAEAQTAAAAVAPPPAAAEPALWVVSDADSTIYLFGTFHALKDATQWRTPKVDAALRSSSILWLELADIGAPGADAAALPLIQRYGLDPARPLSSKLTAAENAKLAAAAAKAGVDPAQLQPLRPWLAALQLALVPLAKAGYDPQLGVDTLLASAARAEGKTIRGFETSEQQLRFFADLSPELEKQMLLSTLDEVEEGPAMIDRMSEAWSRGDLGALEREMVADMKNETPAFYKVVLADRNAAWARALNEHLKGSGTTFVAVGAAHLIGPDSVQAELAELGVQAARH
ncbi:MAG: TraB/GumN family protein [Proteobacteria bacterium]|nr:TraB/GumN family protein [Pseudomonadota bacterium]